MPLLTTSLHGLPGNMSSWSSYICFHLRIPFQGLLIDKVLGSDYFSFSGLHLMASLVLSIYDIHAFLHEGSILHGLLGDVIVGIHLFHPLRVPFYELSTDFNPCFSSFMLFDSPTSWLYS